MVQRRQGNGALVTQTYDAAGRQTGVVNRTSGGTLLLRHTYAYDAAGRRTVQADAAGVRTTWAYDNAGQLTAEQRNGAQALSLTYRYDPAGNRTLRVDAGVRTTSTYDAANQMALELTGVARTTYAHDACGNRTRKDAPTATTFLAWDARGKLTTIEPPSGTVTLAYDAVGRRTRKETPTQTKQFLYDFKHLLQEVDGGGTTQKEYTFGADSEYGSLISQYDGAGTLYHEFDALGSTQGLLDDAQAETDKYVYRAFGLQTHTAGTSDNAQTFVGREGYFRDSETDLYLLDARYYDPASGRFVSEDPIGFRGDINLYRYCANDPVNKIDPSGLQPPGGGGGARAEGWFSMWLNQSLNTLADADQEETAKYLTIIKDLAPARYDAAAALIDATQRSHRDWGNKCWGVIAWACRGAQAVVKGVIWLAKVVIDTFLTLLGQFFDVILSIVADVLDLLGVDTSWFKDLVSEASRLGRALMKRGGELIGKLITAAIDGVKLFFEKHLSIDLLLDGLKEAFFPGVTAPFPKKLDAAGEWAAFVLDALGLSWDDLLAGAQGAIAKVAGPQAARVLVGVLTDLDPYLESGEKAWAGLSDWGQKALSISPSEAKDRLGEVVVDFAKREAVKGGTRVLAKLNPLGGLAAAVGALWDTYQWVKTNLGKILGVVKRVGGALTDLIGDDRKSPPVAPKPVSAVAETIGGVLKDVSKLLISYVVGLLLGKVAAAVRAALQKPREFVWGKVEGALRFVADKVKKAFGASLKGEPVLLGPFEVPGGKGQVWVDEEGEVWLTASPRRKPLPGLEEAARKDPRLKPCAAAGEKLKTKAVPAARAVKDASTAAAAVKGRAQGAGAGPRASSRPATAKSKKAVAKSREAIEAGKEFARLLGACPLPGGGCGDKTRTPGGKAAGKCFVAGTRGKRGDGGDFLIEEAGQELLRVLTAPPLGVGQEPAPERKWSSPRRVWFYLDQGGGRHVRGWLLREASELAARGVAEGMPFGLDLPEQGAVGTAWAWKVEAVQIPGGPGRLVTGWFCHSEGQAYDLRVEGEPVPIVVTPMHPIYAPDRGRFLPAIELRPGERLLAADGSMPGVETLTLRAGTEPVFNLEVDADHCYRVGEQGILVHNASLPGWCKGMTVTPGSGSARDVSRLTTLYFRRNIDPMTLQHNPGRLTATEVPIIKRVRAKLATGTGSDSSTAVRNLFVQMQYWIMGGDFQAAYDAGLRNPIGIGGDPSSGGDTVGHIVGAQFGGQGAFPAGSTAVAPDNVFPQSAGNQGWYEAIETMWRTSVDNKNTVCIEVELVYRGGTDPARYRPREVRVTWWEDCGGTVTDHPLVSRANN
jgi:RHS repeat-associated protein